MGYKVEQKEQTVATVADGAVATSDAAITTTTTVAGGLQAQLLRTQLTLAPNFFSKVILPNCKSNLEFPVRTSGETKF